MTFAAVGSMAGGSAALSFTSANVGDLLICEVLNFSNSTVWATALTSSGAGATTWVQAGVKFSGTTNAYSAAVFLGTVTTAGAQTITPTWSGTAPSFGIVCQEFSSTVGGWAFDVQGNLDSASTANFASLTPNNGAGELYFGYATTGNGVAGSTSGYVYNTNPDGNFNVTAYNVACPNSATFPVWGASLTSTLGIMILVYETPGITSGPRLDDAPVPVNIPVIVTGRAGWRNAGHSR